MAKIDTEILQKLLDFYDGMNYVSVQSLNDSDKIMLLETAKDIVGVIELATNPPKNKDEA